MRRLSAGKKMLAAIVIIGLAAVSLAVNSVWSSRQTLDKAVADLDASEPGWRLEDMLAARNAALPPPGRNPFDVATAAHAQLPANWAALTNNPLPAPGPVNASLTSADRQAVAAVVAASGPSLATADRLVDLPPGGRTTSPAVVLALDLSFANLRSVSELTRLAALHHADAGRSAEAMRAVRGGLGVPRAVGGEPTLINRLVENATAVVAARSAARVLNLGEHPAGLAELQTDFERVAAAVDVAAAVRGERAFIHARLREIAAGDSVAHLLRGQAADHAEVLRQMTATAAAFDLPPGARPAALAAIPKPRPNRPLGASSIMTAVDKAVESCLRTQAELSATAAGIACERSRQRAGIWPATLADIPKDTLAAVPVDPFTGRPLLYKRLADGIVVYSVGPDGTDDGGDVWAGGANSQNKDFGLRLWDADKRGVPPSPAAGPAPE